MHRRPTGVGGARSLMTELDKLRLELAEHLKHGRRAKAAEVRLKLATLAPTPNRPTETR